MVTYDYFPEAKTRSQCSGMEVSHVTSMFLTGHGAFMAYLHRFAKSATNECQQCGQLDTASHVVFECTYHADARSALIDLMDSLGHHWPCDSRELVKSTTVFKAFERFVHAAGGIRGRVSAEVRPTL